MTATSRLTSYRHQLADDAAWFKATGREWRLRAAHAHEIATHGPLQLGVDCRPMAVIHCSGACAILQDCSGPPDSSPMAAAFEELLGEVLP